MAKNLSIVLLGIIVFVFAGSKIYKQFNKDSRTLRRDVLQSQDQVTGLQEKMFSTPLGGATLDGKPALDGQGADNATAPDQPKRVELPKKQAPAPKAVAKAAPKPEPAGMDDFAKGAKSFDSDVADFEKNFGRLNKLIDEGF